MSQSKENSIDLTNHVTVTGLDSWQVVFSSNELDITTFWVQRVSIEHLMLGVLNTELRYFFESVVVAIIRQRKSENGNSGRFARTETSNLDTRYPLKYARQLDPQNAVPSSELLGQVM